MLGISILETGATGVAFGRSGIFKKRLTPLILRTIVCRIEKVLFAVQYNVKAYTKYNEIQQKGARPQKS